MRVCIFRGGDFYCILPWNFIERVHLSVVVLIDEFGFCKFGYSICFWYITSHFHSVNLS